MIVQSKITRSINTHTHVHAQTHFCWSIFWNLAWLTFSLSTASFFYTHTHTQQNKHKDDVSDSYVHIYAVLHGTAPKKKTCLRERWFGSFERYIGIAECFYKGEYIHTKLTSLSLRSFSSCSLCSFALLCSSLFRCSSCFYLKEGNIIREFAAALISI